jgi:uncharacterized RmlC-like cupin family protein
MGGGVRRIAPSERTEGAGTPGMIREEAVATDGLWAGFVRTSPGMTSGWHHHGDYETAIFILSGDLRMEFGPGGETTLDGRPGDFLYVPRNTIIARATRRTRSRRSSWRDRARAHPSST